MLYNIIVWIIAWIIPIVAIVALLDNSKTQGSNAELARGIVLHTWLIIVTLKLWGTF